MVIISFWSKMICSKWGTIIRREGEKVAEGEKKEKGKKKKKKKKKNGDLRQKQNKKIN